MKTDRRLIIVFVCVAGSLTVAVAAERDMLPEGRTTVEMRPGERNPFAQIALPVEQMQPEITETEELRLRKIIGSLKVNGVAADGAGRSFLLGSMILREGDTLPLLIAGQTETLTVTKIGSGDAIVTFTEIDKSAEPRRISIPLNIAPKVNSLLYGEAVKFLVPTGKDGKVNLPKLKNEGVQDALKGAKDSNLQGVTNREFEMMGDQNAPADKSGGE